MIRPRINCDRVRELNQQGLSDCEIAKILRHGQGSICYTRHNMRLSANFPPRGGENVTIGSVSENQKKNSRKWRKNHLKERKEIQRNWYLRNREYALQKAKDNFLKRKRKEGRKD